jgi:hypothetical protein
VISVGAGEDVVIVGDAGGTKEAVFRANDEGAAAAELANTNIDTYNKQRRVMVRTEVVTVLSMLYIL